MKLRAHFGPQETKKTDDITKFYSTNKTWEPKNVHHTISTFLESFTKEVNESIHSNEPRKACNLNKHEIKALSDLMNRNDIIICNADKGGATVIMDVNDYIKEANRQLNDETHYKKLQSDPTSTHLNLINDTIERFKKDKLLSEKLANSLKITEARTPLFYLLPKIHKEGNPGRPVISSIDCHTSKISEYVDYYLQPFAKQLSSYVKDTTDFINKLKHFSDQKDKDTILVTLDVKSLYTNIPNQEGIEAVKSTLYQSDKRSMAPVITSFLWLILTLNNFTFNDTNYLQTSGTSMGSKASTSYANLFMGQFEKNYIYPKLKDKCPLYLRYIDDIFFLWQGTEAELKDLIKEINSAHHTIKFESCYSREKVNFLDTVVTLTSNNQIITSLYHKPTDRHAFLHRKSYHPLSTKRAIPYSQALRIKRICSKEEDYQQGIAELKHHLIQRGYNADEIDEQINKASQENRENLLKYKEKTQDKQLTIITTYNKTLPNIKTIIDNNWHLLHINETISKIFAEKPKVAYKRNPNLKQLIGQHRISKNKVYRKSTHSTGLCKPCRTKQGNLCCTLIKRTTEFTNRTTGKKFQIFHQLNCKSSYVIYLLECTKCNNKPYVGKCETPMNLRINTHRADAKKVDSIPVDKHFLTMGHIFNEHAEFTIIETVTKPNLSKEQMTNLLLKREDFWMTKLNTLKPNGFNESLNFPQ